MGTISLTAISSGDQINAEPLQNNFNTIKNEMNGGLDADNLEAAAVTTTKIADSAVTTAKMSANASINITSKARAYKSAAQNISTPTKIQLDAETYDVASNFDSSTNYRFTAPVNGYYMIMGQVGLTSVPVNGGVAAYIYKNGSSVQSAINFNGDNAAADVICNVMGIFYLAATDYIELYGADWDAGTRAVTAGSAATSLAVHLISL